MKNKILPYNLARCAIISPPRCFKGVVRDAIGPTKMEDVDEVFEQQFVVGEQDAASLMRILIQRGYFHEKTAPLLSNDIKFRSDDNLGNRKFNEDGASLIETSQDSYIMLNTLQKQFAEQLNARGRWSIEDAAEFTSVPAETLRRRIVPRIVIPEKAADFTFLNAANGNVKEILTSGYLSAKTDALWATLHQSPEGGIVSLAEAAESIYRLPIDVTVSILEQRISAANGSSDVQILRRDNASRALVTAAYLKLLQKRIGEVLAARVDAPVEMKAIAKANEWEVSWVMRVVKKGLLGSLPGEFHGETYVPTSFTDSKRRSVVESLAANGYVTSHLCLAMFGVSPSQMKAYATADTERLVLEDSVVLVGVILAPLVESAGEATDSTSWLDLQLHLPVDLLQHHTEDARVLVEEYVLTVTAGVAYVGSDGAIFFSQPMVDEFAKNELPALMKQCASARANELLSSIGDGADEIGGGHVADDDDILPTGKEKRKTRKAAKSRHTEGAGEIQVPEYGTVSLDDIVRAVVEAHQDLSELDSPPNVLAEVCKLAFCPAGFETRCADAVRAELNRLQSERKASALKCASYTDVAFGDCRDTMAAFEDPSCFATACYVIQAKAKFLAYAVESADPLDGETKGALEREFLSGCCADLTSRVTQYALFKHDVDEGIFSFRSDGMDSGADKYFAPPDLAVRSFRKVYLSCAAEKAGRRCDPLQTLREELPGSAGVLLARQWILCGGECYQGGVKLALESNGEACTRPGNADAFLTHVRENCLTICGLPFANLDKKSEKKFLNGRRLRLTKLLEDAVDAGAALDLRIMLLYQLIKNIVASGPLLRGPILRLLARERKISDSVSDELLVLAARLENGEEIDQASVERLKDCSQAKNKS